MNVRTCFDQDFANGSVAFGGGPHQSGLSFAILRVDLRAMIEQLFYRTNLPGARRCHEHALAAVQRGVCVGAGREKFGNHGLVAVDARH